MRIWGAGFPMKQLASNEDVVLHLRPHWIALVKPGVQTALIIAALILTWLFLPVTQGDWPHIVAFVVAIVLFLIFPMRPFLSWATTHIVVTTQRVIRKSRWIGIEWIEISHDQITDVRFTQGVIERTVKAGDIKIESAGRSGQEVFTDLPHPGRVQRVLSEMKTRPKPGSGQPLVADELTKLQKLHDEGVLTDAEFRLVKQRLLARV